MSATTVRSILNMILENGLQMDDEIHFRLTSETDEVLGTYFDIDFVHIENHMIVDNPTKQLVMFFDLNDVTDDK